MRGFFIFSPNSFFFFFLFDDINCVTDLFICLFFSLGASVLYMSFLAFALFQTRADFRNILFFFDPELRHEGPDTKVTEMRFKIVPHN